MNEYQSPGSILRKIILFCLLGFVTLVLFGPLVAVLSAVLSVATVILSFALVGFLVWSLFQAILYGRQTAVQNMKAVGQGMGRMVPAIADRVLRVLRFPFWALGRIAAGLKNAAWFVASRTWWTTRFVGSIVPVAATGVLVGAAVGLATGMQTHDLGATVPIDALCGGLMGVGVGVAMAVMERRTPVRNSPPALS